MVGLSVLADQYDLSCHWSVHTLMAMEIKFLPRGYVPEDPLS